MPPTVTDEKMTIMKQKWKSLPCGEGILDSNAGATSSSYSKGLENHGILDMHQRPIGEDGVKGLSQSLQEIDEAGLIAGKQTASKENGFRVKSPNDLLPVEKNIFPNPDFLLHFHLFQHTAKNIDDGQGKETSTKVHKPIVYTYTRRYKSGRAIAKSKDADSTKSIRVQESSKTTDAVTHEPITSISSLFDCSGIKSRLSELAGKDFNGDIHKSERPHPSLERNGNPLNEQAGTGKQLAVNTDICKLQTNPNKFDELLILGGVMQKSITSNDKHFQDYDGAWGYHKYTKAGLAHKEKFARLRARQKIRLALRKTSGKASTVSGTVGDKLLQLYITASINASRVHAPTNDLKDCGTFWPLPAPNRISAIHPWSRDRFSDYGYTHINCAQNDRLRSFPTVPCFWKNKTGERLAHFSSDLASKTGYSANTNKNIQEIFFPGCFWGSQNLHALPQAAHAHPSSSSTFLSVSSFGKNVESMKIRSENYMKKLGMVEAWFEEELDALWVGVRRHGQGNWDAMLRDPTLKFSKHKTSEDLSARWKKEKQQILTSHSSRDERRRSLVLSPSILPSNSTSYMPLVLNMQQPVNVAARELHIGFKEISSFPVSLQASPSIPGSRQNSRSGSFHLSKIRLDQNQNNDSSETESDHSLAERCGEKCSSKWILND